MHKVYLGLGTNLGNREENLRKAGQLIEEKCGKIGKSSLTVETAPVGFESENYFLNKVVYIETSLTPWELLDQIRKLEEKMGRKRSTKRYEDRVIDIDILLYDDLVIDDEELQIPHPRMHEREFVMRPLKEIKPDFAYPVRKK